MKITIINTERNEKRYTRVELGEFVRLLSEGAYRPATSFFTKAVCFAAEWQKVNGEMKAILVFLSFVFTYDYVKLRENLKFQNYNS